MRLTVWGSSTARVKTIADHQIEECAGVGCAASTPYGPCASPIVDAMTTRDDVSDFLMSRRAKVTPEQVSLPAGGNRRVPGLRRSEVAMLADVSVEYYAQLERGNIAGVSEGVLNSISKALRLSTDEESYLFNLARAANESPVTTRRRTSKVAEVRPTLQFALDSFTGGPAFIRNGRMDILAANAIGFALYSGIGSSPQRPINIARFTFLDLDRAHAFYPDWDAAADMTVAILRAEAGRSPYNKDLQDLVGELSTRSHEFRIRWAAHNVKQHITGTKSFIHPVVGPLEYSFEGLELENDGLSLLLYTPQPGSRSDEATRLLASWAATEAAETIPPRTM